MVGGWESAAIEGQTGCGSSSMAMAEGAGRSEQKKREEEEEKERKRESKEGERKGGPRPQHLWNVAPGYIWGGSSLIHWHHTHGESDVAALPLSAYIFSLHFFF
jgi:hypothetical protein